MTTAEIVKFMSENFEYSDDRGCFVAKKAFARSVSAGDVVGWLQSNGYRRISIKGRHYQAHRLIWLFHHGSWPVGDIDHMNGDKSDNRIENLRDVTHKMNVQNQTSARRTNKVGLLGVRKVRGRFVASITLNGRTKHIGTFDSPDKAHTAYVEEKRRVHEGFVAR